MRDSQECCVAGGGACQGGGMKVDGSAVGLAACGEACSARWCFGVCGGGVDGVAAGNDYAFVEVVKHCGWWTWYSFVLCELLCTPWRQ